MTTIQEADAILVGAETVSKVYLGDELVWPPVGLSYSARILSLNPISYWRLGESSGTVAVDEMGYHNGTYTISPTLGVTGLIAGDSDTAMKVDGVTWQGVKVDNPVAYQAPNFTLEAWVKTAGAGSSYRSVAVKQNAYGIFTIDGVVGTYVWGSSTAVTTGVSINDNVPHHIVVVCQKDVALGSQFYIDGIAVGTAYTHVEINQTANLDIGYNDYAGQEFIGVIDEVAFYNYTLSPANILANYEAGG